MSARTLLNFRRVVFRDMYQRSKISQESRRRYGNTGPSLYISEEGFKVSRVDMYLNSSHWRKRDSTELKVTRKFQVSSRVLF